jgi:hypothetical protein
MSEICEKNVLNDTIKLFINNILVLASADSHKCPSPAGSGEI